MGLTVKPKNDMKKIVNEKKIVTEKKQKKKK